MNDRLIALGIWSFATLVVVSLAVVTAQMTWHLVGETSRPISTEIGIDQHRPGEPPPNLAAIFSLKPFGSLETISAPQTEAQETDLGLLLHGVVLSPSANASIALISTSNQKVKPYSVDEPVPGGALLHMILPDKVILLVNGQQETLSFPKARSAPSDAGMARLRGAISNSSAGPTSPTIDNSPSAVIERYRQGIAANPQTVLDNLGVSVTEQGYQIGQQAAAGVRRAGLRSGDIVARVNGEDVGNIENDRRLFDTVAASGRARVEVIRDGERIIMSFPLR